MSKMSKKQQRLMKEELTRTQVLNLTDLEKVAKYEKSISKKPAITLAFLGLFLIITGFSYNGIINLLTTSSETSTQVQQKQVEEEETTTNETLKCSYFFFGNSDGTDAVVNMTLNLVNDKLISYTKVTTFVPTTGQEVLGAASIQTLLPAYQTLGTYTIPGYSLNALPKGTGFETIVSIDLQNLDNTLLTNDHQWNASTKVELALNDTKDMITTKGLTYGFTCE